jgi:hypothetical protein
MILASFLIGMALCAVVLALLKMEDTHDKFGSAVAMFCGWCAFGMLLMGGTWALGIVVPGLVAAAVLLFRGLKLGGAVRPLSPYKMPLGIAALVSSVVVWVGVLNRMEGLPNG